MSDDDAPLGELLCLHDIGNSVTSIDKTVAEIILAFGRGVTLKGPDGPPGYANLLARIPEYGY